MRPLFTFNGGIHPPQHKTESTGTAIARAAIPPRLDVPLHQSVGNAAKACVKVGDRVLKGQRIGEAEGNLSAAVHAPTSGTVIAIGERVVAHPSGLPDICVSIEVDGLDEAVEASPIDLEAASPTEIRNYLRDMGVVGLGGAVFPSHLKLAGSRDVPLETLVINGAECEPYITCDDVLMRERADQIVAGIEHMIRLMQPKEVLIGIEDNKPEAIRAMQEAAAQTALPIEVVVVPTVYPSGGAKQLIRILTGKEVPTGVRSTDLGVQCFNVATAYTIYRALVHAEPVLSRIVTLTGNVERPGNVEALLGTSVDFLLREAGVRHGTDRVIMGGPMMGIALPTLEAGITKAANCLIAGSPELFPPKGPALPCIRCGKCAEACPADLQPQDLYWFAKAKQFGKAQEWALFDCIECGCCAYVCPSEIPLVDYYRFAKGEIWAAEREKKAANHARERHEFRLFRIEREKEEKAARLAAKASSAKPATSAGDKGKAPAAAADDAEKQAKIKAAMERAAAKRAEADATPPAEPAVAGDADAAAAKQAKIKAAMERAAAQRAAAQPKNLEPINSVAAAQMAEQDRLAQRIAAERAPSESASGEASLGEASRNDPASDEPTTAGGPSEDAEALKRAKILAAMEKAAARRAAKAAAGDASLVAVDDAVGAIDHVSANPSETASVSPQRLSRPDTDGTVDADDAEAPKRAKILESMAKAAARRAAKEDRAEQDKAGPPANAGAEPSAETPLPGATGDVAAVATLQPTQSPVDSVSARTETNEASGSVSSANPPDNADDAEAAKRTKILESMAKAAARRAAKEAAAQSEGTAQPGNENEAQQNAGKGESA